MAGRHGPDANVSALQLSSTWGGDVMRLLTADPQKRQLWGVLSAEIGGGNGLEPLAIGARLKLPVVDADYMGRAFPELQAGSHDQSAAAVSPLLACRSAAPMHS